MGKSKLAQSIIDAQGSATFLLRLELEHEAIMRANLILRNYSEGNDNPVPLPQPVGYFSSGLVKRLCGSRGVKDDTLYFVKPGAPTAIFQAAEAKTTVPTAIDWNDTLIEQFENLIKKQKSLLLAALNE